MPDLPTVTISDVEILEANVTIHGVGSPPEGDRYSPADLSAMATAAQELEAAGEWRVPMKVGDEPLGRAKLGHGSEQTLLSAEVAAGELPAAGWLTNQRVSDDGTKLLGDIVDVPATVGGLVKAGAYRTRSAELSSVTSQTSGTKYPWVVSGLGFLGGKMPAVRTLGDVVAMYEREGLDKPDARVFVVYAASEIIWDAEDGFQDLLSDIQEVLNPGPGQSNYWVSDVSIDRTKAIVQDWDADEAWVVPITVAADGTPTVSPSSDWTAAEQAWVKAAREFESKRESLRRAHADIRSVPTTSKYSDEQRTAFAKAYEALAGTPLDDPAKVTDEMLASAGVAVEEPKVEEPPKTGPKVELEADERFRQFETRINEADERARKLEAQLATKDRDHFVDAVLREGKDEPGQREHIEKFYEKDPELARAFYANRRPDETLAREYGADSDVTEEEAEAAEKLYEQETAARLGIPVEQVL